MSIEEIYQRFRNSNKVCTDTRKIEKHDLFFALKGDNFNGNKFAQQAIDSGANYAIIDEEEFYSGPQCILVNDVLETLQQLATHHRRQFDIPVIGLTGSNGKTTNKELLKTVLSKKYKVQATQGNLNNHIGVPLTLLSMPTDTEMAIIEMGANHQKEIEMLCKIAEPSHGFITNIGKAHLEGFGGVEGVKKGKGELLDFLKASEGYVFVNEKNETLTSMVKERQMVRAVYYGKDERALKMLSESPQVVFENPEGQKFTAHISGAYNFENMQTAYNIGLYFNVHSEDACEALASYAPDNNRSQLVKKGSNEIFLDAYNANPSSMEASLKNFMSYETEKGKVVILGDMFELGEDSEKEHESLGQLIAEGNFETVVLYGENMKAALKHLPMAFYFTDKFSIHNWVKDKAFDNKAFLIKGSRGVSLETIVQFIG
ncbi:UDP-N-acetylmuramoyl-tripeptide--D-alanyl-D-alanine ligase [Jiulongibacter sediminis]|uniref:UDP-N-acetylmuramoyl-tripeptide--D-alanyl-D-alanine ligase n=1 Tax=Jiulongibacter sediminis TaxID=1605367 RepID=A0A0P7BLT3_9BACT|nr:UDP-N-acetylmuramoyl-tripeptide--D-alanyl-D-alanine ligase [Jiulongibacter sediminis]KPM48206.1 UDP-N-acetylmuramoyl-tripeptide--D-alanyl-D-alanine ligase [Jiulongibacter sediminis]TBX24750.1 UDP-N-acetylmuramoyl-tripeptide--D-alanyl-D-alanine ligase [Jiulongibacter sediminis]